MVSSYSAAKRHHVRGAEHVRFLAVTLDCAGVPHHYKREAAAAGVSG
jgi:hypothetical protein